MDMKEQTKRPDPSIIRIIVDRMLVPNVMRFTVQLRTSAGPQFTEGWRYFVNESIIVPPMLYFGKAQTRIVKWDGAMDTIKRKAAAAYYRRKHDDDAS